MGRGRIPMELIQKEKARKATFQKRKNGLMKKVYEFSTLCGVDVCLIIYTPDEFDDQGLSNPETWPQDEREVHRIIEKYHNTTNDRRPKIYDVEEYYKDRVKKVEAETSKVCKEKLKIMYPTWDESFKDLGEEQLRMFVSMLDAKLDACNQRINGLKVDQKGKAIAESEKVEALTSYLASNPNSHLNLMQRISHSQEQFFPPPMKSIGDNNLAFYPFQFGQNSQPSMFDFGPNCTQLMGRNEMVDWANQVGVVTYDPNSGKVQEDGAENGQNSLTSYYNGNMQTMQPHNVAFPSLPTQNFHGESSLPTVSHFPPRFQLDELYDTNMFQFEAQMFNFMPGWK